MIEIQQLRKSYGKTEVLKNIDLTVSKSEIVALIGSSGSGKTTLLRCINFLEKSDHGTLKIDTDVVNMKGISKKDILRMRRKTAMVFQHYDLFLNKTILDNVLLGLTVARNIPQDKARKIALQELERVGLSDKLSAMPYQLSGGQQQRVGIARALAISPEVILLDEPTSSLDPEKVDEVLNVISKVAKSGVTMIIATHEMSFAHGIADKIVFLDNGEILEQGTPSELFLNPKQERTRQFLAGVLKDKIYGDFI
jgi:L-cystine transport system ATP-binding protein